MAAGRISARLQNALCHKFSQRFVVVKLFLIDRVHDQLRPEPGDVLGEPVGQADAGLSDIVKLLEVAEPVDHKPRPEPNKCFADFLFYFVFPPSGDAKPNLFQ